MSLTKRILSCMLLLLLLALVLLNAWHGEQEMRQGKTDFSAVFCEGKEIMETLADAEQVEEPENKKIAITFDDGPHPVYTKQLLDGLQERKVKATFFVTGEQAENYPELIERMDEEGHLIGNHTYSHVQLRPSNRDTFKEELIRTSQVIYDITGKETEYVRPPYGAWDKTFETELNMFPVLWTVDPLDWCSSNAGCIARSILAKAGENDIILMHDEYESTVQAAFMVVDQLLKEGYEFVTVDEILFD